MNVLWAVLITAIVTATAVGAMLLVRRRAPDGSYFADGDRAAGVFGVLATGFAVLLGLVVVLAFTSYDESKSGADTEALLMRQLVETAQFMPARAAPRLSGTFWIVRNSLTAQGLNSSSGKPSSSWLHSSQPQTPAVRTPSGSIS